MYDKDPQTKAAARPMTESLPDDAAAFLSHLAERKTMFEGTGGALAKYATFALGFPFPEGYPMPADALGMEFRTSEFLPAGTFTITANPITDCPQLCVRGQWPTPEAVARETLRDALKAGGPIDTAARVDALNKTFLERLRGEKPAQATPPNSQGPVEVKMAADEGRGLVAIQFVSPVAWFAVPPEQAVALAELLIKHARTVAKALGRPLTVNIG